MSKARQMMGLSRDSFYRYRDAVEEGAAEALEVAKAAEPATPEAVDPEDPLGLAPGDTVQVRPEGMDGVPAVAGTLRFLDAQTVVLDREDDRVGRVSVHFPRVGYQLRRA